MNDDPHPTPAGEDTLEPLAVLELLEERGTPFPARVAAYLDPAIWLAGHTRTADPDDVITWTTAVATVARVLRGAAYVGHRAPHHATTVTAVTEITEVDLLLSLAEQYDRDDIAAWIRARTDELRATGPDGRPLIENPTGISAVVVDLTDRSRTTRRTS